MMNICNRYIVIVLLLLLSESSSFCTAFSGSNTHDKILHWEIVSDNDTQRTLRVLQQYNNVSAILHFIELTRNFSTDNGFRGCVRTSLSSLRYSVDIRYYKSYTKQAEVALKTANILTNLFTLRHHIGTSSRNESVTSPLLHPELYWSLVKVNVQSDPQVFGHGIAFEKSAFNGSNREGFAPYAYRNDTLANRIAFLDLSKFNPTGSRTDHTLHRTSQNDNPSVSGEWFWEFATPNYSAVVMQWIRRSENFVMSINDGVWTSPYIDCGATNTWLITFMVPFYGSATRDHRRMEFKGLSLISINLRQTDINQCARDESLFADSHLCHTDSTQCQPIKGMGFRRGAYLCQCRDGFYMPNRLNREAAIVAPPNYFEGTAIEEAFISTLIGPSSHTIFPMNFLCIPCQYGCKTCTDDSACFVQFDSVIRNITLGIQSFCATITIIISIVIGKLRRSKTIASSRWIMLEMILLGAFMLYITVVIRYYSPSPITCFLEPWFRELGFAFCYGAIVIKLYRIFAEFQTRKAHRVCVRDKDLLKYLAGIVLVVIGYMSAWTALVIDGIDSINNNEWFNGDNAINITRKMIGSNILEEKTTADGLEYIVCRQLSWDYVTEIGELFFLLTGVYITYCIRNAKREIYREKWNLAFSIYLETIISLVTYILKHCFWNHPNLLPDHIFLLYMIRCQLTVSIMIVILFLPKIWYHHRPPRSEHHRSRHLSSCDDHLPEAMKLHSSILSNGEVDIGDINLSDMDPEDIRSELRRIYTQLQVLRNKTLRKDNPHISKRRGGRKSHRRFSLQPFHHKHKPHEPEITEISRTPEESTASFEGPSQIQADGPSVHRIDSDGGGNSSAKTTYIK